jgi:O-methyltransferase involved in polyketide biosynthesis
MSPPQGVADTLFIPLVARISVSKKFPEYFFDEMALTLKNEVPNEKIQDNSSEYSILASVARYYNLDLMTKQFLSERKKCNIINLGAGLDTAYFRLKDERAIFYEVDLPEVIEKRRMLLGESRNEILIGGDMFSLGWVNLIDKSLPSLLVASGVFQFYNEERIINFIHDLRRAFPQGYLLFDATNEKGLKYANKCVKSTGLATTPMNFYVNDCEKFAEKCNSKLLDVRPFFIDARKELGKRLNFYTMVAMKMVDKTGRAIIVQLKF